MSKALLEAAAAGDINRVTELLKNGADIHYRNEFGATALLVAAGCGQIAMVEHLRGLNPKVLSEKDNSGCTALLRAASNGHIAMVEHLRGLNPNVLTERTNNGVTVHSR